MPDNWTLETPDVIINPYRFASSGGPPTINYEGYKSNASNLSTYTFTLVPIGTESGRDAVIIQAGGRGTGDITSVTIGGTSATEMGKEDGNGDSQGFYYLEGVTGTTTTVVVTCDAKMSRLLCSAWSASDIASYTPYDTASVAVLNSSANFSLSGIDSPTGDSVALVGVQCRDGGVVYSGTAGFTERLDTSVEFLCYSVGDTTFSGSGTYGATFNPNAGGSADQTALAIVLQ